MKIAHVTDIHLPNAGETFLGIELHDRFRKLIDELSAADVDRVIFTGDFVNTESVEQYLCIGNALKTIPHPVSMCAGNHDNNDAFNSTIGEMFSCAPEGEFLKIGHEGITIYVLDTRAESLETAGAEKLAESLHRDAREDKPAFLFMHHPPTCTGSIYLDQCCALKNVDEMEMLIQKASTLKAVFCGHYHSEIDLEKHGVGIHVSPAFCCQFDQNEPTIKISNRNGGYRIITLSGDTYEIETHYLDT